MTIKYRILYWRDIPAQIKAKAGGQRLGRPLSSRFLVAIDEAAMRAGLTKSDDYLAHWRKSEWLERDGELVETAEALVAELEAAYPPERLSSMIRQHGLDEGGE